jgi:prephenate dehydratase
MSRIEVAVLGPAGTFTEIAARKAFGDAKLVYCDTVDQVFEAVAAGKDYGVVAIENSLEGSVNTTMDCLIEYDTKIVKEIVLDIGLCLAASQKTKKEDVKIIVSHPHALAQCRRFLSENYPKARLQRHESTAAAMKEAKDAVGYAAVGPKESAQLYGLSVLEDSIADASSQTRFVVIAKEEAKGTKTSIIFAVKDKPGALYQVLKEFADKEINLTKIESRPSKRKLGEYVFFVDFEGSLTDKKVNEAIVALKENSTYLKILGSY